jgi:methionine-rich copper-binding protein CopC
MVGKLLSALVIVACAAVLLPAVVAFGHADYDHSTPGEGATVSTAPARVDAYFTADIDPSGENSLNVTDSSGADVDNNDVTIDPADATHMSVTLQSGLANGVYTVAWATLSAEDGEEDDGTFTFTVQAGVPTTSGGATSTPVPGAPVTGFGPGGGDDGRGSLLAYVALGVVGVLVASAGTFALRRSRS